MHLLHRTTREVKVTHRGMQLYKDCAPLLGSLSDSVDAAIDEEVRFKGTLSVSMPVRAGLDFLGHWLIDFASQHEELQLELSLSNVKLNLVQENVDLAFRVGPLVDSSAIALRLWDIPYALCATQAFIDAHQLNSLNLSFEKLSTLPAVVSLPASQWLYQDEQNKDITFEPQPSLVVDDLELAYHAVKSGKFIGMLPTELIKDPEVAMLTVPNHQPVTRTMFAYYMGRRHSISQIRHIVEYIRERNAG
ncbi:LysR substrate-binding domain-containing protein [Vibrio sp. SCSIO 43136]|uniref:LysR substrate-binding domain-containing protein n=1 Tax=Vibrio sp. SCSIO 43136 TaxID=2819101 RepID=UPI00207628C5|nr:LysR substrate-binding domain-containing protein [Vibrio sp. SCSIO 43136]